MGLDRTYGHIIGAGYVHARKSLGFVMCVRCLLGGLMYDLLIFGLLSWTDRRRLQSHISANFSVLFYFYFYCVVTKLQLRQSKTNDWESVAVGSNPRTCMSSQVRFGRIAIRSV